MSATKLKMEVVPFDCRSSVRIICLNRGSEVIEAEKILVRCRELENESELTEDNKCSKDVFNHNADSCLMVFNLTENCMYEVEIKSEQGLSSRCIEFYSVNCYSQDELWRLYGKACAFIDNSYYGRDIQPFNYLYRTKELEYYQDIEQNKNNIMEAYAKDCNGDPRSPLTGRLRGLFFQANVDFQSNMPFATSPYGTHRLLVKTSALLTEDVDIYFADFYCRPILPRGLGQRNLEDRVFTGSPHNITVVAAKRGSPAWHFCEERLCYLEKLKNPFLKGGGDFWYYSKSCMIEVLYANNININEFVNNQKGYFENVSRSFGSDVRAGSQTKPTTCGYCNI